MTSISLTKEMTGVLSILVFLLCSLVGCGPQLKRIPFNTNNNINSDDWQKILNASTQVELTTFFTGTVTVPTNGMLNMDDPKTDGITTDLMVVEVYAHWVRHPTKGDYLIDTGLNKTYGDKPHGDMRGIVARFIVKDSHQNDGEDIHSQVTKYNIDLNGVFLTHAHMDHTSGIPDLPKDIHLYIGKDEPIINYPMLISVPYFDEVETLIEFDFKRGINIPPFDKVINVFSDGSLWAISTPGHSPGHVSYLVNTTEGPVLLTGDASLIRWGFENDVIPGWADNETQARKSLASLKAMSRMFPDMKVIFGHER